MDEIQAAVLRVKLAEVHDRIAVRRHQVVLYAQALQAIAQIPVEVLGTRYAYRNYVIHVDARERGREGMTARGIATAVSYCT